MFTEEYLNGTYYKYHKREENKHLLFLLPGQSLTPRAFWEFKLPEEKTHVDYFLESGIDVILFDPLGYGKSTIFKNYNRIEYAKQITDVTDQLTKHYDSKTILGFSTSTAPSLIAGHNGYFNKIIVHSPLIRQRPNREVFPDYENSKQVLDMDFDYMVNHRIEKVSDSLIPKSNKIDGWIDRVKEVSGESWKAPYQTIQDIMTYYCFFGKHDIPTEPEIDTLRIVGEYDAEIISSPMCDKRFRDMFPLHKNVVIPNSTHFSMWENNSAITRNAMIDFIRN